MHQYPFERRPHLDLSGIVMDSPPLPGGDIGQKVLEAQISGAGVKN